jgi:integrase
MARIFFFHNPGLYGSSGCRIRHLLRIYNIWPKCLLNWPQKLALAYATHSLENGINPRAIQKAMGHSSLETTMRYLHTESLSVKSPLETVLGGVVSAKLGSK